MTIYMSPVQAKEAFNAFAKSTGLENTHMTVLCGASWSDKALRAWLTDSRHETICSAEADDFATLYDEFVKAWREREVEHTTKTVSAMALEIIRLTDELGECSDAALRASNFSTLEIQRHGAAACEAAERMALKGPFRISLAAKANAA